MDRSTSTPANMKVHKINTKLIKPHTPTPQNLNKYHISFLDQFTELMKFGVVLFYESSKPQNNLQQLEESLAEILVQFYPLAGRYRKKDHLVDCSDEGAQFVEAEALDIELMDLVTKTEIDQLNLLFPAEQYFLDNDDPLLSIQATHFPCGGLTISIRVSHVIFDASSLSTFIAAWSNATNPDTNKPLITPLSFPIPSLLPYMDLGRSVASEELTAAEVTVKRLVFNKETITRLRSKIKLNMNGKKTISRVRLVCAVIAKALNHGKNRSLAILQPINMRERTIPPQPKHACGNFAIPSLTLTQTDTEEEIGMEELVRVMGESVEKSIAEYGEILSPDRDGRIIIMNALGNISKRVRNTETNAVVFTDWSKFGFYEADFGWGKPVWTGIKPDQPFISNTILMSDRKGDGIEAWLHLKANDMRSFEQDEDIANSLRT